MLNQISSEGDRYQPASDAPSLSYICIDCFAAGFASDVSVPWCSLA